MSRPRRYRSSHNVSLNDPTDGAPLACRNLNSYRYSHTTPNIHWQNDETKNHQRPFSFERRSHFFISSTCNPDDHYHTKHVLTQPRTGKESNSLVFRVQVSWAAARADPQAHREETCAYTCTRGLATKNTNGVSDERELRPFPLPAIPVASPEHTHITCT